ncbi:MAG: hypothetical protein ACREFR_08580 [Limisphaerales bacterium]
MPRRPRITPLAGVLDPQSARWLTVGIGLSFSEEPHGSFYDDYYEIGLQFNYDGNNLGTWTMETNAANLYGLPFISNEGAWGDSSAQTVLLYPGDSLTTNDAFFYPEVEQPQFQLAGYDFWDSKNSTLPGDSGFSITNQGAPVLAAGVGQESAPIAAYEKLAVENSSSNVYAYVGQYFASAYEIDSDGNMTTNLAGVLSPYGQFFATEPRQVALVTMPDPDTGEQGTGVVDVIALDVDANHDGTMDFSFTGPDFTSSDNPYRFWVNDDQDEGDDGGNGGISTPGDPQADGIRPSGIDDNDQPFYTIHGTRDLVDFFPVYVNIASLFQSNALSGGISYSDTNWQFVLSQGDGALRFAYTDLTPTNYMNYLRDMPTATNLADASAFDIGNNPGSVHFLTTVSNAGVSLSRSFIGDIATNNGGIILMEAWEPTTQPLVLTIYHGTNPIAQTQLALSISEVEQMFRHKNIMLQPEPGMTPDRLTDADVPNEPSTSGKNFIFVDGYNVNPNQARGWESDIFKRMYWSGSHAKFYGVTWEGADSQVADSVTIDYQTNVVNAFNTAPLLNTFLNSLSGTNVVAAHSLGNMVVLSALNDYSNQDINTCFMIDAAVPMEAIDSAADSSADMISSSWTGYNGYLLASGWNTLWPSTDARSTLTWNGRLAGLQNASVYNFYSSGEEVLREYTGGYPPSELEGALNQAEYYLATTMLDAGLPAGDYTWAWQEMLKGRGELDWVFSSTHGGWKFNTNAPYSFVTNGVITQIPDSQATLTLSSQLQTNAFFDVTSPSFGNADLALFGSIGSSYAQANQNRILSDAIPALTLPVGANLVSILGASHNFDMSTSTFENGWPAVRLQNGTEGNNWHHSDCRQIAYPFTHQLFDDIVTLGGLQ